MKLGKSMTLIVGLGISSLAQASAHKATLFISEHMAGIARPAAFNAIAHTVLGYSMRMAPSSIEIKEMPAATLSEMIAKAKNPYVSFLHTMQHGGNAHQLQVTADSASGELDIYTLMTGESEVSEVRYEDFKEAEATGKRFGFVFLKKEADPRPKLIELTMELGKMCGDLTEEALTIYRDKDGRVYPFISKLPFLIYTANNENKLNEFVETQLDGRRYVFKDKAVAFYDDGDVSTSKLSCAKD